MYIDHLSFPHSLSYQLDEFYIQFSTSLMTDIVPLLNSEQESQKEMQRLYELLKLGEWNKAASALKGPLRTMDIFQQFKNGGELAIRTYFNTLLRRNEHLTKVLFSLE